MVGGAVPKIVWQPGRCGQIKKCRTQIINMREADDGVIND